MMTEQHLKALSAVAAKKRIRACGTQLDGLPDDLIGAISMLASRILNGGKLPRRYKVLRRWAAKNCPDELLTAIKQIRAARRFHFEVIRPMQIAEWEARMKAAMPPEIEPAA